ncbi:MAG TPA: D-cysteine desulfhydrase [Pirellulales bacterium]|nr:D-cysteine desulfhydrase [Pirellulales bacterium]
MDLSKIPRVSLAHLPTPFASLPRLSAHLGGPAIYIKRDDETGLATGGNKARKLEFLVADALAQGCDTLVTTGGPQSNHARQTAAAAARLGLKCQLLLPRLVAGRSPAYEESGNVLLDRLFGADVQFLAKEDFKPETFDAALERLRAAGRKPYFIPIGGSTALGALGYMAAVPELFTQAHASDCNPTAIVVASGSGGTHAGIVAGLIADGHAVPVTGISVSGAAAERTPLVTRLAVDALGLAGHALDPAAVAARVRILDQYIGAGYGQPTPGMIEAVRLVAELEGILLDPVYTGKAMAGLIDLVRKGGFTSRDTVVFWHTGGSAGLFAYPELFTS